MRILKKQHEPHGKNVGNPKGLCKRKLGIVPELTSKQVETRLLEEFGVAALAGTSFGAFGEGYLRFSYANSQENIRKALARFADFAATVRSGG